MCSKCSNSVGGIILAVVLSLVALAVAVAVVVYVMSGEARSEETGVIGCLARYIPLQSIKIVVVVWQILTQVRMAGVGAGRSTWRQAEPVAYFGSTFVRDCARDDSARP